MKLLHILIIVALVVSCSRRPAAGYFVISTSNTKLDTLPIDFIRVDTFPNGAQTLVYYTNIDTIGFFIRKDTNAGSETTWGVEDQPLLSLPARDNEINPTAIHKEGKGLSSQLQLIKKDSTLLGGEMAEILYYKQEGQGKGDYFYCWSPSAGVFCRYAASSPEFAVLQFSDSLRNKTIGRLLQRVNPMGNEKLSAYIAAQQ